MKTEMKIYSIFITLFLSNFICFSSSATSFYEISNPDHVEQHFYQSVLFPFGVDIERKDLKWNKRTSIRLSTEGVWQDHTFLKKEENICEKHDYPVCLAAGIYSFSVPKCNEHNLPVKKWNLGDKEFKNLGLITYNLLGVEYSVNLILNNFYTEEYVDEIISLKPKNITGQFMYSCELGLIAFGTLIGNEIEYDGKKVRYDSLHTMYLLKEGIGFGSQLSK